MFRSRLEAFATKPEFRQKGGLLVALVVTDQTTKMDGQVLGLGKAAVQGILKRNGIDKVLAKEGGEVPGEAFTTCGNTSSS